MREIMAYDEARTHRALVNSGVPKERLEDYVQKASDAERYYTFEQLREGMSTFDDLATDILRNKYLAPGETGPLQLWDRVARAMASVEPQEVQEHWYEEFLGLMRDFKFIPGGRVMHGAGRTLVRRESTMSNCYVIPITWGYSQDRLAELDPNVRNLVMDVAKSGIGYEEAVIALDQAGVDRETRRRVLFPADSLEGIYQNIREAAEVYRSGGGVGTDLSVLRPKGATVNATMDKSPGVTAFMDLLSESTETVAQQGRRGALMLTLRVSHPDVEDFIEIKNDPKRAKVKHANVSVLVDHEFMEAVANDKPYTLWWENEDPDSERYGKREEERVISARELWNKMIRSAHASAEPGIIFWETMQDFHNGEYATPLTSTNPCGEQPLASYTACNLGNLNLLRFVKPDSGFDFEALRDSTRVATRFLDDVIEYNHPNHALTKIQRAVANDRRTGLGITGLGDALVAMSIKYDSDEAIEMIEKIMRTIRDEAYITSIELAKERGPFPLFDWNGISQSKFIQSLPLEIQEGIRKHGLRNVTLLTVPPVGTGSIVAQTSSGVEPIFSTGYKRRVKRGDRGQEVEYKVVHPLIRRLFGDDENLPDYVVTAHNIDPFFRVRIQGTIQRYNDTAISSTINLPEDITVERVDAIYRAAYKEGLKGVTVYREGSRQGVLETEGHATKTTQVTNGSHPRKRPKITTGQTEKIRTGKGNIYVTINEDEQGVAEVFSTIGKAGGDAAAQAEGISRLVSLAFRSGISPKEVVRELKGIGGAEPVYDEGELILSTPDAIGTAIERYLNRTNGEPQDESKKSDLEEKAEEPNNPPRGIKDPCPECGYELSHEGSCNNCRNCGYSKC